MAFRCQHCGGKMKKKTKPGAGIGGQLVALGAMLIGLALCVTIIGAIIGIPLILIAAGMTKPTKVWRCSGCRTFIPRA